MEEGRRSTRRSTRSTGGAAAASIITTPTPTRSSRRGAKKTASVEQFIEQEISDKEHQTDLLNEMLAEAAHGDVIVNNEEVDDAEIFQEHILEETPTQPQEDIYICSSNVIEDEQVQMEQDIEMYNVQEIPATSDEKSSSFPFGNVAQSETSEDAQEEQVTNENRVGESSLLASLVGDNANSLPSVGGCDENDIIKKDDFETKEIESMTQQQQQQQQNNNSEKLDSDESNSDPAIAEELVGNNIDTSEATIVNAEIISEDELPLPTKPEINDAEEVSDDELPAPQRAELPADAEVISEDELPANTEKKSRSSSPRRSTKTPPIKSGHKRKMDGGEKHNDDNHDRKYEKSKKKTDEQYNPMSPTSESNDSTSSPVEKKSKIEVTETDSKEKKRDKDKEKEKEKEKNKEQERKRLPDLDKYWRSVKEDPADFTGWTYLLQYVDNESDAEAAREAYDAFLANYPYCYGYWRKYADYEKRKGSKLKVNEVFERGLEAIPLSVDLWIHYLTHVKSAHNDDEDYIRSQFDRAIGACGLEFRSDKLWDSYLKWEIDSKRYQRAFKIYDRLIAIPTQGYSNHFDNFQDLINQHSLLNVVPNDEIKKICIELRGSSTRSSSRSKHRRRSTNSKEKEKHDDANHEPGSLTPPIPKEIDLADEDDDIKEISTEDVEQHNREELIDLSTLSHEEISAIKDRVISLRRKVHKTTVAAVTARWTFEEGIKRPYFHVKPLERCQLKNWKDYLDYEIEKGENQRVIVLFERCLIACALYDEFWLKMIRYLETKIHEPGISAIITDVFRRACHVHHPDKPSLHLMWAAFEECQNNFDGAANILVNIETRCPGLLQLAYRRINVERRRGDLKKCRELYEHYIETAKNKNIAGSLAIKYARFLNKICNDLEGGLRVLQQALDKDQANTRVALQMIDLCLQRPEVNEEEVVAIMNKFMARDNMEPEQKVLFAQRKVEFLEDFGSSAKGLQDAQRGLQIALNRANEAKKKRESSPTRKSGATKDSSTSAASNITTTTTYSNNSSTAQPNTSYNYNSANSAYYGQQNSGAYQQQQQSYDNYYNHWQYGSNYSGYSQWSGYGNYY